MRRVYDDEKYGLAVERITNAYYHMTFEDVSSYSYGTDRAEVSSMMRFVSTYLGKEFKYGKTTHANGIGNNNAIELIYTGNPNEEQICGLLHINSGLYGEAYMYATDIDGNREEMYGKLNKWGWHI